MGSSGGGSSGEVAYPSYIETLHNTMIQDCYNSVSVAQSNNPYSSVASSRNPSTDLTALETRAQNLVDFAISSTASTNMSTLETATRNALYDWTTYGMLEAGADWDTFFGIIDAEFATIVPSVTIETNLPTEYYDAVGTPGRPFTPADDELVSIGNYELYTPSEYWETEGVPGRPFTPAGDELVSIGNYELYLPVEYWETSGQPGRPFTVADDDPVTQDYELYIPTEYWQDEGTPGRPYAPDVTLNDPELVAIDTSYIQDEVDAAGDIIDDQIETDILPRFEAGMRDLNSVLSSEFIIGKAIIEGMRDRDVMKLQADLRVRAYELYEGSKQNYQQLRMKKNDNLLTLEAINADAHNRNEDRVMQANQLTLGLINSSVTVANHQDDFNLEKDRLALQAYDSNEQRVLAANQITVSLINALTVARKNVDDVNISQDSLALQAHDANEQRVLEANQLIVALANALVAARRSLDELNIEQDRVALQAYDSNEQRIIEYKRIENEFSQIYKDLQIQLGELGLKENQFKASGTLTLMERKHNDIIKGYDLIIRKIQMNMQWMNAATQYGIESKRLAIIAQREYTLDTIQGEVADAGWELSTYQAWANLCAAPAGGTAVYSSDKRNAGASALSGAIGGAASGAMIGSAIPGVGTGIGAVVGGLVGLAGGLFS